MANIGDRRLREGWGDGRLWGSALSDLNADITALFSWFRNRMTDSGLMAPATQAGKVKTTAACDYLIAGTGYQKAATDNLFDLSGLTTGASGYAKVLLQLDASGNASVKKGPEAPSQAQATFPTPDAGTTPVGWVQLGPSYAGGALTADQIFDGTPLTAAQLTSYTDQ